jgi:hypothetical protein
MLFNKRLLKQKLTKIDLSEISNINLAKETLTKWQAALTQSDLDKTKETGVQGQFLIKIFEGVLGYKTQSEGGREWNMFAEPKTDVDSREADGGLGFFSIENNQTRVVIELKDAKTNLDAKQKGRKNDQSPVEQAFDYLSKFDGCKWAIVSNFKEIRLYSKERGQGFYEEVDLLKIHEEDELKKFIFLFSKENLINRDRDSVIDDLLKDSFVKEQDISKSFYKTYKETRTHLFNHLSTNNQSIEASILLEKAQKILDRVIFICFCEDLDLIPAGIFRKLLEASKLTFTPSETKVWDQAKGLFQSIDKGNPPLNINKFNGGLFKQDEILNALIIKDEIILELLKLSEYDFDSDLNVNILGHIFEQSISDLEEMRLQLVEKSADKKSGKRKKDGIFYTPEYITRYIVDQAVGGWLMDRKRELGFETLPELTDEDFKSIRLKKGTYRGNNTIERYRKFWEEYKEKIRNIKVLDPACGSGAFLNQVFDYLYKEGQVVNEALSELKLGQREIFDLDKHILNNNIFGVDLNEESVQITKLSLWLKTANKSKELTTLDKNIKCGNSLIDDPVIAGEKAFNWKEEFKEIFNDGGFDVIVGNPPYVRVQHLKYSEIDWYKANKETAFKRVDISILFFELAIKILKNKGIVSYISSNQFTTAEYGRAIREFLLNKAKIREILDLGDLKVFSDALTYVSIFTLENGNPEVFKYLKLDDLDKFSYVDAIKRVEINPSSLTTNSWVMSNPQKQDLITSLAKNTNSVSLKEIGHAWAGLFTGMDDVLLLTPAKAKELQLETEILLPVIRGHDPKRYSPVSPSRVVIYPYKFEDGTTKVLTEEELKSLYPVAYNYLLNNKESLIQRKDSRRTFADRSDWYGLTRFGNKNIYKQVKIVSSGEVKNNKFTIDLTGSGFSTARVIGITINDDEFDIYYVLAVLNSLVAQFFIQSNAPLKQGGYYTYSSEFLNRVPIPKADKVTQTEISDFAKEILKLNGETRNMLDSSIRILVAEYGVSTESNIDAIFSLNRGEFLTRFIKNKLNLDQKEELLNWMSEKTKEINFKKELIKEIELKLNRLVFKLYKLSNDEINIINNSTNL